MKMELSAEEMELVNGGWNIFSPVKKAIKDVAVWSYNNMIKPVGEGIYDHVIKPAIDCLNYKDESIKTVTNAFTGNVADLLNNQ